MPSLPKPTYSEKQNDEDLGKEAAVEDAADACEDEACSATGTDEDAD